VRITASGEAFAVDRGALRLGGSEWALLPPDIYVILARIHEHFEPLAHVLGRAPVMGVKSGDNAAFFLDVKRVRRAAVETFDGLHVPLSALCRCVRGRDVRRWTVADPPWMLWPPSQGWKRVPRWLERFAAARGVEVAALRLSYVRPEHLGVKVVWKDLSRGIAAAVLGDLRMVNGRPLPLVPNQTLYALDAASVDEAHVLAALLNSTIANALTIAIAERAKDFHFRYFGRTIARVPIPKLDPSQAAWTRLLRLARRAPHDAEAAAAADGLVTELYGVSAAEHDRLASYLRKRLGYDRDG